MSIKRLDIYGAQQQGSNLPIDVVTQQLCDTRDATNKMVKLMRELLDEVKELRKDTKKSCNEICEVRGEIKRGNEKATESLGTLDKLIECLDSHRDVIKADTADRRKDRISIRSRHQNDSSLVIPGISSTNS